MNCVSTRVYGALMLDNGAALSPACYVDFMLDNDFEARFGALQNAVRRGAAVEDLRRALGSGAKLTALVAKYGSNVVFPKSAYDLIEEMEADADDPEYDAHVDQQAQDSGYDDDDYPDDDGDSAAMEMLENQDFAQDGEFENMIGDDCGFYTNEY